MITISLRALSSKALAVSLLRKTGCKEPSNHLRNRPGWVPHWLLPVLLLMAANLFISRGQAQFTDSTRDKQWSPDGLQVADFRVVKPEKKSGSLSVGAVTSSQPGVEVSVMEQDLQRVLKISMTNRFNYNKSWISANALTDTGLLKHEQGHFDLNEIYTRKTFEQLRQVRFSNGFKKEIAQVMGAMNSELSKIQQNYERETMHGLIIQNQRIWNQRIALALQQTPPYEGRQITQTLPPEDEQDQQTPQYQ